ncbi:hypothetical protein N7462_000909 [Penicillium macrosclerotiorum]|uniref:uncharacterized protein n=1 Tax=Penicillium macrosclerotiorum TaxID=303699 RepID=UPI002546D974|nr:uncharacterized protein N7462_000909 [Penicillium macrosclerotiorum]KAJ5698904.1 hypothetical protein N7462_000909 [Penicillium macrosclerotiorum]
MRQSSGAPALTTLAFEKSCSQLEKLIANEKASATFICGGQIQIEHNTSVPTHQVSRPVRIAWTAKDGSEERKLVLPITAYPDSNVERIRQLATDCSAASFGRRHEDVIDPEYRNAGKLDPEQFLSSFHPADFGIIEDVEQFLLPNFISDAENQLPSRKLTAELYKLTRLGDLVDHSDCEHEIKTITAGERITLTSNLYVTESGCNAAPRNVSVDSKTLPLYASLRGLLAEPAFLKDGGVLGIYCSHAYPHSSKYVEELIPRGLKGVDLVSYSILRSLGMEVHVLPVLSSSSFDEDCNEEEAEDQTTDYLREGKYF